MGLSCGEGEAGHRRPGRFRPLFVTHLRLEVFAILGGQILESLISSPARTIQERAWLLVQVGQRTAHSHRLYQLSGLDGLGDEVARDQTWLALGVGVEVLAAVHRDVHLSFSLPRMYHLAEEINELILLPQSLYDSHALVLGRAATVETRTALGLTGWLWLALFRGNCRLLVGSRGLLGLLIVAGMV